MKRLIDLGVVALFVVAAVGCGKKQDGNSDLSKKGTTVAPVVNVTGNQPPATGNGVDADCLNEKAAPPHQVGVFTFEENYNNPKGPAFFNTCWYTYSSSKFRSLMENSAKGEFRGANHWDHLVKNYGNNNSRELAIQPHTSMSAPANDLAHYAPLSPPFPILGSVVDATAGQVPWMMDLRFDPVFYAKAQKVELEVPVLPIVDGSNAKSVASNSSTFGVVLNGKLQGADAAQKLTGFVVLVKTTNRGANKVLSTQLAVLKDAPELWADYAYLQYPGVVPPQTADRRQDNPIRPTNTSEKTSPIKLFNYKEVAAAAVPGVEELVVKAEIERNVPKTGEATLKWSVNKVDGTVVLNDQIVLANDHVIPLGGGYGYLLADEYGTAKAGGLRHRSQLAVRNLKVRTSQFAK